MLVSKTANKTHILLEDMAFNNYQWPNKRSMMRKVAGVHTVDQLTAISTQISALSNQFVALTTHGVQPTIKAEQLPMQIFLGMNQVMNKSDT